MRKNLKKSQNNLKNLKNKSCTSNFKQRKKKIGKKYLNKFKILSLRDIFSHLKFELVDLEGKLFDDHG